MAGPRPEAAYQARGDQPSGDAPHRSAGEQQAVATRTEPELGGAQENQHGEGGGAEQVDHPRHHRNGAEQAV